MKLMTSSIVSKTNLSSALIAKTLALLTSPEHQILKQAVGSTRKSMTDLSYEVNDEFIPEASPGASMPLVTLEDISTGETADEASMQLITDVKKVE